MNTSGAAQREQAAPVGAAAPADLPVSVARLPDRSHLEYLLRQVYGNLNAGRHDVALTNMCQAVQLAVGTDCLSDSERVLLRLIGRDYGGFA